MIYRSLSSVVFVIMVFAASFCCAQQGANYKDMEAEVLKLVNEHRTGMGLKPLRANGMITAAAERHTKNMATKQIPFGHDRFNERMADLNKQLKPVYSFAENVAYGAQSAKEVVDQWLNSAEHKKNMEGKDYNITGIGIQKGTDGVLYFTEIFLYRVSQ